MHVTNDRSPAAARSNKELMEEVRVIGKGLWARTNCKEGRGQISIRPR